jgi:hypothetical protein
MDRQKGSRNVPFFNYIRVMKKLSTIILLILIGCDSPDEVKKQEPPKSAYERTDVGLRYLMKAYAKAVIFYRNVDFSVGDTTNVVLKYLSAPIGNTNLTEIKTSNDTTYIYFHKAFFDPWEGRGYDLKIPYIIHIAHNIEWECIGPRRELKTNDDLDGFLLMFDTGFKYRPNQPSADWVETNDFVRYWFKDWIQEWKDADYDFSELEVAHSDAGISLCNM